MYGCRNAWCLYLHPYRSEEPHFQIVLHVSSTLIQKATSRTLQNVMSWEQSTAKTFNETLDEEKRKEVKMINEKGKKENEDLNPCRKKRSSSSSNDSDPRRKKKKKFEATEEKMKRRMSQSLSDSTLFWKKMQKSTIYMQKMKNLQFVSLISKFNR